MPNEIQFILYNLPKEEGKVQVVIKDETIWCTQKAMSRLFGVDKSGISRPAIFPTYSKTENCSRMRQLQKLQLS